MSDNESLKITKIKNLDKLNFNSPINISVDANVNIKTILSINSYIFDTRVDMGTGKAVVSGKIGVKVMFLDTDNMTNAITDNQTFTETITDSEITPDCFLNIADNSILTSVLPSERTIKINCEVNIHPIMYCDMNLTNTASKFENMVVKKSEVNTYSTSTLVNTNFDYTLTLETKSPVSKILAVSNYFSAEKVTPYDEYALVEGKILTNLIFETGTDGESEIKELTEITPVKSELTIPNLTSDTLLDLSFSIDNSKENITTEFEDGSNEISLVVNINATGVAIKNLTLELVDDMYSLDNEIELTTETKIYNSNITTHTLSEVIEGEFTLDESDSAIDFVISNQNILAEITNSYIKDENLYLEGIISSQVVYMDENKELKRKPTELPFILNTKIGLEKLDNLHACITILDSKIKAKRGTILELEYKVCLNLAIYSQANKDMIENVAIGKPLDFSAYDYQIYLAKPNETMWDLCKRIRISPDDLASYNRDLPLVMSGSEKIIIKR